MKGLHSQLVLSEESSSSSSEATSGMKDMRIMGLRSELFMKQSLLDRMQEQLTESKNQCHELSCQMARKSSPSTSPFHGTYYEMYEPVRCEYDELKQSKKEIEDKYIKSRAEILEHENLVSMYQQSSDELGRKYENALSQIDSVNRDPNLCGETFDKLHSEINDKDVMIRHLLAEREKQRGSLERAHVEAGRAINRLNDQHSLASDRLVEVEEMSNTITALKHENQAASSEMQKMKLAICSQSSQAAPRDQCEEKCARLKAEMDEMKRKKDEEFQRLHDDLKKVEDRKDHYKNCFSQAEDHAYDVEQEYRAEAEAFEKLRNEYYTNIKELEVLEKDKSRSSVSLRKSEKLTLQPWPRTTELAAWKGSVIREVCLASGDRNYEDWKTWLSPCLADQPDMDMLVKAPEMRFQSIDAKLSHALRKVIENAGERSMQVKYDMSMKNQIYGKSGDFIKGRELFAMILISFKSPDHTDVLYNAHHLFVFTYYGDDQLEAFYNKWLDIVYNMKHDDRPSTNSLRDMLFRKIENTKLMHFDISRYRTFNEGHPEKTYEFLIEMIKGYIARGKQERLLKERERAVKVSLTSNKTTPALEDIEKPAAPIKTKKETAAASSSIGRSSQREPEGQGKE